MRKLLAILIVLALALVAVASIASAKGGPPEMVTICHVPPGNPENAQTLTLPLPALEGHMENGQLHGLDYFGPCVDDEDPGDPECPVGFTLVGDVCVEDDPDDGDDPVIVPPVNRSASAQPSGESITAWSVNGDSFFWMYSPTGEEPWYVVYNQDGSLALTPVELRDRFNRAIGEMEYQVRMTRLTLRAGADTNPAHYRVFNAATGQLTAVWVEHNDEWCQEYNVCGTTDFRGN